MSESNIQSPDQAPDETNEAIAQPGLSDAERIEKARKASESFLSATVEPVAPESGQPVARMVGGRVVTEREWQEMKAGKEV